MPNLVFLPFTMFPSESREWCCMKINYFASHSAKASLETCSRSHALSFTQALHQYYIQCKQELKCAMPVDRSLTLHRIGCCSQRKKRYVSSHHSRITLCPTSIQGQLVKWTAREQLAALQLPCWTAVLANLTGHCFPAQLPHYPPGPARMQKCISATIPSNSHIGRQ